MCAAAHGWVRLGRIVYALSSAQLTLWRSKWGFEPGPVAPLPITTVLPEAVVAGPDTRLSLEVRPPQARLLGVDESDPTRPANRRPALASPTLPYPHADLTRCAHQPELLWNPAV